MDRSLSSPALSQVYLSLIFELSQKPVVKPGPLIVVRVAEHACDDASERILKPSTNRLQIFLVRDQYLRSLLPHEDQTIAIQLEKHVLKPMLAILTTYMETRFKSWNEFYFPDRSFQLKQCTAIIFQWKIHACYESQRVSNCFAISLWFGFAILTIY